MKLVYVNMRADRPYRLGVIIGKATTDTGNGADYWVKNTLARRMCSNSP